MVQVLFFPLIEYPRLPNVGCVEHGQRLKVPYGEFEGFSHERLLNYK